MSCGFSVQKFSFTSQTASLSIVTLFTPATDGDFIIGVTGDAFGISTSSGNPSYLEHSIGWTEARGSAKWNPYTGGIGASDSINPISNSPTTQAIHALAGNPVTLNVVWNPVSDPIGSQYYDLYITVIGG